jgi:hypothetical protein
MLIHGLELCCCLHKQWGGVVSAARNEGELGPNESDSRDFKLVQRSNFSDTEQLQRRVDRANLDLGLSPVECSLRPQSWVKCQLCCSTEECSRGSESAACLSAAG